MARARILWCRQFRHLRDLRKLVDQAAEPVASSDADVVLRRRGRDLGVGWLLAEGSVRPVGVVVIDVLAEGVVQMSPAGDEDAVGALAPGGGDPPLADRAGPRRRRRPVQMIGTDVCG